jgi:hypothetical protein
MSCTTFGSNGVVYSEKSLFLVHSTTIGMIASMIGKIHARRNATLVPIHRYFDQYLTM